MVITGLTRNQLYGLIPYQGFESLTLRQKKQTQSIIAFVFCADVFATIIYYNMLKKRYNKHKKAVDVHHLLLLIYLGMEPKAPSRPNAGSSVAPTSEGLISNTFSTTV